MNAEKSRQLAEKIALLLEESGVRSDDLRSSLEKINERLDKIESQIAAQNLNSQFSLRNSQSFHPSQEKFDVAEIIAEGIIENSQSEKACPYEPTGKPCDHCAMCNSRGF